MSNQKPAMLIPALIGGGLAGILSGIPFINCLCCLWIIGGAALSANLLSRNSPAQLSAGDGAVVGIFSGLIAAFVDFIVRIPFQAMGRDFLRSMMEKFSEYTEEFPSIWSKWLEEGGLETSMTVTLFGLLISAVIFSVLGALGGIIGISLFGKKPGHPNQGQGVVNAAKNPSDHQS